MRIIFLHCSGRTLNYAIINTDFAFWPQQNAAGVITIGTISYFQRNCNWCRWFPPAAPPPFLAAAQCLVFYDSHSAAEGKSNFYDGRTLRKKKYFISPLVQTKNCKFSVR
jgi:hypothetical protein